MEKYSICNHGNDQKDSQLRYLKTMLMRMAVVFDTNDQLMIAEEAIDLCVRLTLIIALVSKTNHANHRRDQRFAIKENVNENGY